ncbi:hypothetical protein FQN55_007568 [Onygenales sp. PD_40]|nr:hypothetical protein FQN55_007568 [Onygenales sp. PD_40]
MASSIPPVRHDPFVNMNHDCLNLVLAHLRPLDIIQCTLVSKLWRAHVHGWISSFGLRLHWQHLYNPDAPDPIKRYTDLARIHVLHEYGEPTSVREYKHSGRVDSLHWQFLPYAEDGSIHDMHSLDISFAGTKELKVTALLLNEDGYLYASFQARENYCDALWFLPCKQMIWHNSPLSDNNEYKPILIGENRLYFRDSHGGELVIVDLQTKELECIVPIEYPIGDASCKLFQTNAKAAELIVHIHTGQARENNAETHTIILTNSITGKTHQKFTYTGFRISFHSSPSPRAGTDRDFALILHPNRPLQLTMHSYALIHYHSPHPHPHPHPRTSPPTYHPTSTSVILFPSNHNLNQPYLSVINPFTMHLTTLSSYRDTPIVPVTLPLSPALSLSTNNPLHIQLLHILNNPPIPIAIDPDTITIYHAMDKVRVTLPAAAEAEAEVGRGSVVVAGRRRVFKRQQVGRCRSHGFEGVGRCVFFNAYAHGYVRPGSVYVFDYLERKGGNG